MTERSAFKRHRVLKVLAVILMAGAFVYCLGAIKPFVDARNMSFEDCPVYFVNGGDFVRITDSGHGIYSVGDAERDLFSFTYDRGTYFCQCDGQSWKMRFANENDIFDLRSGTYLWGTAI